MKLFSSFENQLLEASTATKILSMGGTLRIPNFKILSILGAYVYVRLLLYTQRKKKIEFAENIEKAYFFRQKVKIVFQSSNLDDYDYEMIIRWSDPESLLNRDMLLNIQFRKRLLTSSGSCVASPAGGSLVKAAFPPR
jgi:hypothetical protein